MLRLLIQVYYYINYTLVYNYFNYIYFYLIVKAFNKAAGSLVDNKLKKERDEIKELTDKGNGVFNPMMSGYK